MNTEEIALEVVQRARALITDPTKWTQGEYARGEDGEYAPSDSTAATCWCSLGAIIAASEKVRREKNLDLSDTFRVKDAVKQQMAVVVEKRTGRRLETIHGYNDREGRKHEEVLSLFDETAAVLKEKVNG